MSHLEVPDARLYYEVRGSGPLVVLVGAPMDAQPFEPLADLLATDHTVLTTDPRGIRRSTVADRGADSTPELRADDLSRLIAHLDAGPATVLGSSGGAVSALALTQAHPEQVTTVIAHEPPVTELLEDVEDLRARTEDIVATHRSGDVEGALRKFLLLANLHLPEQIVRQMVDDRDEQATADADYQNDRMMRPTVYWRPDLALLRSVPSRVVIGIGEDSTGQLCDRTSRALADGLGVEPTSFPGGHVGFAEDPKAFAERWRAVL
ncbi:alpha/beta hydrolase [Actinosynnema sp. NPDC020468]|uniref:alpha/beta fold hydrolase n=1 Tax=Actinosynnema sp. NPDC020468 TaxID=3154488 RepID=UPI0033EFD60C